MDRKDLANILARDPAKKPRGFATLGRHRITLSASPRRPAGTPTRRKRRSTIRNRPKKRSR